LPNLHRRGEGATKPSAAPETRIGASCEAIFARPPGSRAAPLTFLRRAVLHGELTEQRALVAIEDFIEWSIDRIPHISLVRTAWQHRHNVNAYDSFYVAAARLSSASLLTADGPLARAPALGIAVENIRLA
jgi:predicted nucleic acid-binding protein